MEIFDVFEVAIDDVFFWSGASNPFRQIIGG